MASKEIRVPHGCDDPDLERCSDRRRRLSADHFDAINNQPDAANDTRRKVEGAITLFYLPNVLSVSVIGLIFVVVLRGDDAGLVNNILSRFDFGPVAFLLGAATAMPSIAFVAVWWTVGFNMLILLAGLQNISEDVNDAARVDGANGRQHFWRITVPLLRRPLTFVVILQIIFCFQLFGLIDIMTKGGPGGKTRHRLLHLRASLRRHRKRL